MTFLAQQNSWRGGEPIEIYKFTSPFDELRYTSYDANVNFNGNDYFKLAGLTRTAPEQTGSFEMSSMELMMPTTSAIVQRYVAFPPPYSTFINIARFHRNDPDLEAYNFWHGRVLGVKIDGASSKVICESYLSVFKRLGLRQFYQNLCNHVLYDTGCRVDKTLFRVTDSVTFIDGITIKVPAALSYPEQWFRGGFVETTGVEVDRRLIIDHVGQDITLLAPFYSELLSVSDIVDLYAGCDHSLGTCKAKFNNVVNYGGFPFVPTNNLFIVGLRG